jgi:hypothetical protein
VQFKACHVEIFLGACSESKFNCQQHVCTIVNNVV